MHSLHNRVDIGELSAAVTVVAAVAAVTASFTSLSMAAFLDRLARDFTRGQPVRLLQCMKQWPSVAKIRKLSSSPAFIHDASSAHSITTVGMLLAGYVQLPSYSAVPCSMRSRTISHLAVLLGPLAIRPRRFGLSLFYASSAWCGLFRI